jgi:predicted 3-demethylubiquinone-9 3-methyltransferase (glyoxalase superfamily)
MTTRTVTPFLMFQGDAEAAMALYARAFPDARVATISRFGADTPGREGTVQRARMTIHGQDLMILESPMKHAFTFTPSISLYVTCLDEADLDRLVAILGEGGGQLMPPGDYGFSRRFAWISDRFGVSWQLDVTFPAEPSAT